MFQTIWLGDVLSCVIDGVRKSLLPNETRTICAVCDTQTFRNRSGTTKRKNGLSRDTLGEGVSS